MKIVALAAALLVAAGALTSVRIKEAWACADVANLLIEGEGPAAALSGEVLLLREEGAWVVDSKVLAPR